MPDNNWTISLGGVALPVLCSLNLQEQVEEIGGFTALRMLNGALRTEEHFAKMRVTVAAEALSPDGLAGVNRGATLTLRCAGAEAMRAAAPTVAFTLPAARRSDAGYEPRAWYWRGAVRARGSFASIAGDLYTVDTVSSAEHYEVEYWQELEVKLVERPRRELINNAQRYRWSFVAEQV